MNAAAMKAKGSGVAVHFRAGAALGAADDPDQACKRNPKQDGGMKPHRVDDGRACAWAGMKRV